MHAVSKPPRDIESSPAIAATQSHAQIISTAPEVAATPPRQSISVELPRARRLSLSSCASLMLVPGACITLLFFVMFTAWTALISLTDSRLLPNYEIAGWLQYRRLFASEHWWTAVGNFAVYAVCLVGGCILLGYALALLIDRGVRWRSLYRTIFLLPLSISFVVTGLIWRWLLEPGLGAQHAIREAGWTSFTFDWLMRSDRAIYAIAMASVWQSVGIAMLVFMAALRGIDHNVWKIAKVDGIPSWRMYLHVITPMLWPAFCMAAMLLLCSAIKTFDVVVTLTGGGPGFSSDLPAHFVVELMQRQELGMAAAGACLLLAAAAAAIAPYLYIEARRRRLT